MSSDLKQLLPHHACSPDSLIIFFGERKALLYQQDSMTLSLEYPLNNHFKFVSKLYFS